MVARRHTLTARAHHGTSRNDKSTSPISQLEYSPSRCGRRVKAAGLISLSHAWIFGHLPHVQPSLVLLSSKPRPPKRVWWCGVWFLILPASQARLAAIHPPIRPPSSCTQRRIAPSMTTLPRPKLPYPDKQASSVRPPPLTAGADHPLPKLET